ncbi:MAG: MBL fold metallo-hydrolase, partial [Acidobacteria bacterium]
GWTLVLEGRGRRLRIGLPLTGDPGADALPAGLATGARVSVLCGRPGIAGAAACVSVLRPAPPWRLWVRRLREGFRHRARRRFHPERSAAGRLAMAAVAGEKGALDLGEAEALRASGLAHLAVVSGLHAGLLAATAASLIAALRLARPETAGLATAAALLLLLPWAPPVGRAALALASACAGSLAGRPASAGAGLGAAVLLLLVADPSQATAASFVLTVAATAALVLARHRDSRLLLAAAPWLATQPLLVRIAGRWSPWALPANVVAVPCLVPLLAFGWAAVAAPEFAGALFARPALSAAAGLLALAGCVSRLPGSGILAPPLPLGWTLLAEAGLAALLGSRRRRGRLAGLLALAAAGGWAAASGASPRSGPAAGSATVLDVGQGQSVLLQAGGHALLADAGPSRSAFRILDALRRRGVLRLDGLLLSHGDGDHCGAALVVLAALRPGWIAAPEPAATRDPLRSILAEAAARGVPARLIAAGDRFAAGPFEVSVWNPARGETRGGNDASLVLTIRAGGLFALLPGDAGLVGRRVPGLPVPDLVVAAHHGAPGANDPRLIGRLRPRWVLVSSGRRFGHPDPMLLARLRRSGIRCAATVTSGPIRVGVRDGRLRRLP